MKCPKCGAEMVGELIKEPNWIEYVCEKKKSREITDKIMLYIKRALNAIEYPEDSEFDKCPDCGTTPDKGACFYCKMD